VKHGGIDEVRADLRWVCLRQNVGGDAFVLAYFESREKPPYLARKYYISGDVQLANV
jgi:hypothetical protein